MDSTVPSAAPLPPSEHQTQLRRAVIASTVGTAIEWYDFFLYSTVTGLVFAKLFFPQSDPWVGTLEAFAIYAVGFVARPVGAAIFGHYGDRIGRKSTLIATLLLMGLATFFIALVPSYQSIGIWGAVILTVLRCLQGIGVGGEWGGSVLLSMEWARTVSHRGFIASWPQFGVPAGLFLGNLAVFAVSAVSGDQFLTWGWRIPFLLSIILVAIGLYIRLGIMETPIFARLVVERRIERQPTIEVIRRQPKDIILTALVRMGEQAPFYIFTAFVFSYGTAVLKESRDFLLVAVLAASLLSFVTIPLSGHISDRIGRRTMYVIGAVAMGIFGFVYFALLNTAVGVLIFLAIVLSLVPHAMMYGPQAALIAESFTGRLRYSGASLGYQLASVIAGGARASDRRSLVGAFPLRIRDCRLYPGLRAHQHRVGSYAHRPHRQGHQPGIPSRVNAEDTIKIAMGAFMREDRTSASRGSSLWKLLLFVPFVALLWVPFYNSIEPVLWGIPFFYWYQFLWVFLTSALIIWVHRRTG